MFSLQTLLRNKDRVFQLLESSAQAACEAALALHAQARHEGAEPPDMAPFRAARQRSKELMTRIGEELVGTFVTRLDREDIEAINTGLYRIPKTAGKFAARHALVATRLGELDFDQRTALLVASTAVVAEMVREMRAGLRIEPMRALLQRLHALEAEADRLLLEPWGSFYLVETDPVRVLLAKDLFETLEEAIDVCRDVGNCIYAIVLKNS